MPEQDPRQGTGRPRPGGTAATGQHPVARTRETSAGPSGTAPVPVVRQTPAGPAAPRPGVRQPESQRPTGQPPVRSRLRTAPPAAPQQQPGALRPVTPPTPPQRAPRPAPVQPFSQLAPVVAPTLRTPAPLAPPPEPPRRRRPVRGLFAAAAVLGLGVLWGLPAFASEALDAPPVAGVAADGVQSLQVDADAGTGSASADSVSGSLRAAAPSIASPVEAVGAGWMKPVQGHLGDPFGPRPEQPVPGVNLFHRGQDVVAACGAPIRAAASGTVEAATYWGTYGNWILVDHGDGVAVGYAHESRMLVSVGQHVSEGQLIGLVGQTGAATGCHLHLEVHLSGVAVNPVPFFAAKHISLG
ncbi:hypothetical protein GCM10025783_02540 [Amnibacterium soli]|uniref:M23ase beta-sheet core domain-containing protein n=1 Tax=Amnibacterium soli TaxID=1282736 RepID=A0ABP8YRY4_9MICO